MREERLRRRSSSSTATLSSALPCVCLSSGSLSLSLSISVPLAGASGWTEYGNGWMTVRSVSLPGAPGWTECASGWMNRWLDGSGIISLCVSLPGLSRSHGSHCDGKHCDVIRLLLLISLLTHILWEDLCIQLCNQQTYISNIRNQIRGGVSFQSHFRWFFIIDLLMQHKFHCVSIIRKSWRTWNELNNIHIQCIVNLFQMWNMLLNRLNLFTKGGLKPKALTQIP